MTNAEGSRTTLAGGAVGGAEGSMAITISSHLASGILIYAGLGWLLSRWLGHEALLIGGGAILGVALATYLVVVRLRQLPEPDRQAIQRMTGGR